MIIDNTPVEIYEVNGIPVHVKREDMCVEKGGPPFSKMRGISAHMKKLKESGVTTVAYTETSISMAGWGVAWIGEKLGMQVVIFDPQYNDTPNTLKRHRRYWDRYGSIIRPIPAGRGKVNRYKSRKLLTTEFGNKAVLLPLGVPFEETIQETEAEVHRTLDQLEHINTFVINVGSGTIAAGLWRGIEHPEYPSSLYGIMGRTGSVARKLRDIEIKSGCTTYGIINPAKIIPILKDPGWEYTERSTQTCPFPCNPYYDLKAWQWLVENIKKLESPILFWNIGK